MMPNGTAHTAMSRDAQGAAPRWRSRTSNTAAAATMPAMMQSAYARIGIGPSSHTAELGLGMAARFTGAHATAGAGGRGTRWSYRLSLAFDDC